MQDIASLVENLPDGGHEDQAVRVARAAVDEAEASLAEDPRAGGSDPFVAGSVVTLLRRCLTALPGARSPSPPR
jgi:ABC-type ATPase involved in cell division